MPKNTIKGAISLHFCAKKVKNGAKNTIKGAGSLYFWCKKGAGWSKIGAEWRGIKGGGVKKGKKTRLGLGLVEEKLVYVLCYVRTV
jgi:hypothetical protein